MTYLFKMIPPTLTASLVMMAFFYADSSMAQRSRFILSPSDSDSIVCDLSTRVKPNEVMGQVLGKMIYEVPTYLCKQNQASFQVALINIQGSATLTFSCTNADPSGVYAYKGGAVGFRTNSNSPVMRFLNAKSIGSCTAGNVLELKNIIATPGKSMMAIVPN